MIGFGVLRSLALLSGLCLSAAHAAEFQFDFVDAPGEGFFDTTPVSPVPGNAGVTLGEQRRNLIQAAANLWSDQVVSAVPIVLEASVEPLTCNSNGGTLAQAGTIGLFANFPSAPLVDVSYPQALANALSGRDLDTGNADIKLRINSEMDDPNSGCFNSFDGFYYGTSGTPASDQAALLSTLLHEIGHGLGFSSFVESTGRFLGDLPGIFDVQVFDVETTRFFDEMSFQQRSIASRNDPFLVWAGAESNAAANGFLDDARAIVINSPSAIAGAYAAVDASGTPPVPAMGIAGQLVIVEDDNGRLNDGCDTITNTAELNGRIAVIKRSTSCNWYDVAFRFQNNNVGALALLVADNNSNEPADVGEQFSNPPEDFVTTIGVGLDLFEALETQAGTADGAVDRDPDNKAGSQSGFIRLYAPNGFSNGSSVSHWTLDAEPDLLMEPSKGDIALDQLDITVDFMADLGWPVDDIFGNGFES